MTAVATAQMLWLVLWLAAAARVHARSLPGAADSPIFDSARAGNYTFHIFIDRLEVKNVNFNVHLAVFPGGFANHPAYQPPREMHDTHGRPPLTSMSLGPADYGRLIAPFVPAYPLPPRAAGGWTGGAAVAAGGSGELPRPAAPRPQQASGALRPEDHNISPPQKPPPYSTLLQEITTTPPWQDHAFDSRPQELTAIPPQCLVSVTRSEKLITTSPPQYPDMETATFETLQTFKKRSSRLEKPTTL